MHDIDGTQFEGEQYEGGWGGELEQTELELPLHETQELELASALLEVTNDRELEGVLGEVFRAAGHGAGGFAPAETGRALGGILRSAVQQALPGGAIAPGLGTRGGGVAQQAGSLLGLELEGLSPQDQEFETARQLVRLAGSAYRNAAWAPRATSPWAAARSAAITAARRYAPGLLRALATPRGAPYGGGWAGRRAGWGYGSGPGASSSYGYRSGYGYPGYGSPGGYGTGYAYRRPYSDSGGYDWTAQPSYGRRRRHRPWDSGGAYGRPLYAASAGYPVSEPDPGALGPPPPEPPPVVLPPPPPEPPPAVPPSPGEPTGPTEPAAAGELGYFPGRNGWGPGRGAGGPAARNGTWVRRGGVLIVYGA